MGDVRSRAWGTAMVAAEWLLGGAAGWACMDWWRAGALSDAKLAAVAVAGVMLAGARAGLFIALASGRARRREQGS